jgi:hypothetical protein
MRSYGEPETEEHTGCASPAPGDLHQSMKFLWVATIVPVVWGACPLADNYEAIREYCIGEQESNVIISTKSSRRRDPHPQRVPHPSVAQPTSSAHPHDEPSLRGPQPHRRSLHHLHHHRRQ